LKSPDIPSSEKTRLETLVTLNILDTFAEERFDRLTRIAKHTFNVSSAVVSLVDHDRQWFKSTAGIDACETPREVSFCGHAINGSDVLYVRDTHEDERFSDNPLVTGEPQIRFYAGHPIKAINGEILGTLCIFDDKPREFSQQDAALLKDLAAVVEREISIVDIATMDELTKIPNRRGFLLFAQQGLDFSTRHGYPATLVYMDIDNFKAINDQYGHHEGDKALISFANQIKSTFRASDIFGRVGGDEFVVLLGDSSRAQANQAIEKFKCIIDEYNINSRNEYAISFSCGSVKYDPLEHDSLESMMKDCDSIMYANKKLKSKVVPIDEYQGGISA